MAEMKKSKFLKISLITLGVSGVLFAAFLFWMRSGDEAPLDYSSMEYELESSDPEVNGYVALREMNG